LRPAPGVATAVSVGSASEKKSRMAQICNPAEHITSLPGPRQLVRAIAYDNFTVNGRS
jgi:hypothetical protein